MSIAYTCFTTDVIHEGHLNIIREAQKYGDVVVGVMSDKALVQFDRFPTNVNNLVVVRHQCEYMAMNQ